jgi:carotenoid cleavage dioxygenase-like enzyme
MAHMFDGYALLSKARFEGGAAWGSQRFLDTEAFRAYTKKGAPRALRPGPHPRGC